MATRPRLSVSQHRWDSVERKLTDFFTSQGKSCKLSEYEIVMLKRISQNNMNFEWDMSDATNLLPLETRINKSDAVVPMEIAWGVIKAANPTATYNYLANSLFYTYPDKTVFDYAPPGQLVESAAIQPLWNGNFQLKTGSDEIIYAQPSYPMLKVAQVQQYTNIAAYVSYQNEKQYSPMYRQPILMGNKQNTFRFTPISGQADTVAATGDPATEQNFVCARVRVWLLREWATTFTEQDISQLNMLLTNQAMSR